MIVSNSTWLFVTIAEFYLYWVGVYANVTKTTFYFVFLIFKGHASSHIVTSQISEFSSITYHLNCGARVLTLTFVFVLDRS